MPVRFEQQQPFNPALIEAYARSQQQQRALPLLLQSAEAMAKIKSQNLNSSYDRAQKQTEANYGNAQQALSLDAQLGDRAAEREARDVLQRREGGDAAQRLGAELQTRANLQGQEIQARQALQQQGMAQELQNRQQLMQFQQELETQGLTKEQDQYLKALETARAKVMVDRKLAPAERPAAIEALLQEMLPLHTQKKRAEARLLQQRAADYEQQVAHQKMVELKNAELDAKTVPQRTVTIPLPDGGVASLYQTGFDANGRPTYAQLKSDKPESAKPFDEVQAYKVAETRAKFEHPPTRNDEGKEVIPPEYYQKVRDYVQQMREVDQFQKTGQRPPGHGGQPPQGGPPAGYAPEEQRPFRRHTPESMTPLQQEQVARIETRLEEVRTRPDLPEPQRHEFSKALTGLVNILETFGSVERAPKEAQEEAKRHGEQLKKLPPPPMASPERRGVGQRSVPSGIGRPAAPIGVGDNKPGLIGQAAHLLGGA